MATVTGHGLSSGQTGRVHISSDEANAANGATTLILNAICCGDLAALKTNLGVPQHRSLKSPEAKTLLHVAAECGHAEIVAHLLESSWSVNARMTNGDTPLHYATRARIWPDVNEIFFGGPNAWEPRMPKCSDDIECSIIQLLRLRGMDAPDSIAAIDNLPKDKRSPLYDAVLGLMWDRVRLRRELIAAGVTFDPNNPTFKYIRNADSDYLKVTELLISHAADVGAMNESGESPLSNAVGSNSLQIAELLLLHKADPNLKLQMKGGWFSSPMENALEWNAGAAALLHRFGGHVNFAEYRSIHRAAGNGRMEIVLWLLSIGGEINQRDADGDTPLLCAAVGHEEVIAALCQRGADLTVINNKGQGVLHLAVSWPPALKYFINHGLDINARDKPGLTPLHYAARSTADDAIPILLSNGANVNAQDNDGNTPMHIIFFSDEFRPDIEFPTFKALVDAGADKTIRNNRGETPFDLAKKHQYPAEYLALLVTG